MPSGTGEGDHFKAPDGWQKQKHVASDHSQPDSSGTSPAMTDLGLLSQNEPEAGTAQWQRVVEIAVDLIDGGGGRKTRQRSGEIGNQLTQTRCQPHHRFP